MRRFALLLLATLTVQHANCIVHEKRPGATNPSIDPGDRYEFQCLPAGSARIEESGQIVSSKKQKLRKIEVGMNAQIRFLECAVRGNEVIAVFEKATGKEASVVATRCPLQAQSTCRWRVEIDVPNTATPTFSSETVLLSLGILDIDLSLDTGKMTKWRGTGCLQLFRTDSKGVRSREAVGPHCS